MTPKVIHRLPQTFPHKIIFLVSLVLCLCACASIILGVVSWSKRLWGYYLGTGFWSGGIILFGGMFGIVASYIRNICSVKTFMIVSIFGGLASLAVIALAAGGLDPKSGFYGGTNKETFFTHVVHAVYLGIGVLQLTLCILSDGICIYYLFIEKSAQLYRVSDSDNNENKPVGKKLRRKGKNRSRSASETLLVNGETESSKPRKKDNKNHKKSKRGISAQNIMEGEEEFPVPYTATGSLDRAALRRQEIALAKSTPFPNHYGRSASFSTFGHSDGALDHASLIVHPTDDNASVADTVVSRQIPDLRREAESHYAQTLLFGPPLPIEEDEELPPYEPVDTRIARNSQRKVVRHATSEDLSHRSQARRHTVPTREKKKDSKKGRFSFTSTKIPRGRKDCPDQRDTEKRISDVQVRSDGHSVVVRLSRSADLLASEDDNDRIETTGRTSVYEQGVACRSFARTSDTILVLDQEVLVRHTRPHTQSLRVDREKRLDRRRKALSAEVRLNKDQLAAHQQMLTNETGLSRRSDSFEGSATSLLANNRIMPTKFSLRTPVRQIGMPYVCSPIPVKPIVDVPHVAPPPKPPRTFSVTMEDLRDVDTEMDKEVENVFAGINALNKTDAISDDLPNLNVAHDSFNETILNPVSQNGHNADTVIDTRVENVDTETNESVQFREATENANMTEVLQPPEVKLDSGPFLKYVPPKRDAMEEDNKSKVIDAKDAIVVVPISVNDSMTVPMSPTLKPPSAIKHLTNNIDTLEKPSKINTPDKTIDSGHIDLSSERTDITKVPMPVDTKNAPQPTTATKDDNMLVHNELINTNHELSPIKSTDCTKAPQTNTNSVLHVTPPPSKPTEYIYLPIKSDTTDAPDSITRPGISSLPLTKGKEIVYSKVVKEDSFHASPTSPTTKVHKARRLLYSLTDKDVSVFDPVGDSKDEEAVVEVIDTISVTYPVDQQKESQSKVTSATSTRLPESPKVSVPPKTTVQACATLSTNTIEALSELRVRCPPLSPSERILQRKSVTTEASKDKPSGWNNKPVVLQPASMTRDSSAHGARPKTYQGMFAPLSPPKSAFERTSFLKTNQSRNTVHKDNIVSTANEHLSRLPETDSLAAASGRSKDFSPSLQATSESQPTILTKHDKLSKSTTIQPPTSPYISRISDSRPAILSLFPTAAVQSLPITAGASKAESQPSPPLTTPQTTENCAVVVPVPHPRSRRNSQGVSHLPQSQNFRQVANTPPEDMQAAAILHLGIVGQQNNLQQGDNNQPDKPLFAVLL